MLRHEWGAPGLLGERRAREGGELLVPETLEQGIGGAQVLARRRQNETLAQGRFWGKEK